MSAHRVVIVGAGIAGAATAYQLMRRGLPDVVILEREPIAGTHSTGRNAAILRTLVEDPIIRGLAEEMAAFYRQPPEGFAAQPLLDAVGIYLAAPAGYADAFWAWIGNQAGDQESTAATRAELYRRVPLLAPGLVAVAGRPREGVVDANAILMSFLRGAERQGAQVRLGCEATRLRVRDGRVAGVDSSEGMIAADRVVIAAGGWAAELPAREGYPLPLVPYRRHLLVTDALPQVDRNWPVVWIYGDEYYFRPESGGLLMCACDTVAVAPQEGEITDPAIAERIAAKTSRWLPSLAEARAARLWAGMRTMAPDRRFVIGPDPRLQGLFWVAGLGGHGITCAPGVGALAAEWIAENGSLHPAAPAFAPARLC